MKTGNDVIRIDSRSDQVYPRVSLWREGGSNHWKITISQTRVPLIRIFFFAREVVHLSHLFLALRVAIGRALTVVANWGFSPGRKISGWPSSAAVCTPTKAGGVGFMYLRYRRIFVDL